MTDITASRVVLVTGSSSGIGRSTANRLAASGWRVWGGSRSHAKGLADPTQWTSLPLDVTSEISVKAACSQIIDQAGRIDALVHCAGISVAGAIEDVTIEEAETQLATNYLGTVRLIRAVLPAMRQNGAGRIVIIGSIGGLIGLPFLGHYSASKFALDGMVEALRHEVKPFGIQATVIHPGDIRTDISTNQIEGANTGEKSPYRERFRRTVGIYDKSVREARPPEVIAAAVERVLSSRRQPTRLIAGTLAEHSGVHLKGTLPRRWFEAIIAKTYGL